jgi:hypothetical protein
VDNFTTIWNRLKARASAVDPLLCQDIVRDSFRQLTECREWSWLKKHSAFFPTTYTLTGTLTVTANGLSVTSTVAELVPAMVGKQIRVGGTSGAAYPTYTIAQFVSSTEVLLDSPWIGPSLSGQTYQVFQCYFTVPSDFGRFITLVNQTSNYQLSTNIQQSQIDRMDPQRVQTGIPFCASFYDYTKIYDGEVGPVLQVIGSGAAPVSTTSDGYTYPADSIYTIQIVAGGASGTATFSWSQDGGAFSATLTTDASAIDLSNGVQVYFPVGTYTTGNVFIIQATAGTSSGVARYELWPRPIAVQYVFPFIYASEPTELTETTPALPEMIARRGDILLEMALERCALWPGTETMANPYFNHALARTHAAKAEMLINELDVKDDGMALTDLEWTNWPFYPAPWRDGSFLQSHAIFPNP